MDSPNNSAICTASSASSGDCSESLPANLRAAKAVLTRCWHKPSCKSSPRRRCSRSLASAIWRSSFLRALMSVNTRTPPAVRPAASRSGRPVTKSQMPSGESARDMNISASSTVSPRMASSSGFSRLAWADFILVYADWLAAHLEEWTVTTTGELVEGLRRHYIRINPTDAAAPDPHADPNTTVLAIANGGGVQPARNVVGGDFLHLVRLGIRAADDPLVRDSIAVMDRVLKCDLPQGPCWRRYNHDGYGQKDDGGAFDGTGIGRAWPILTGERGHYELAAGRDPMPFVAALEKFANEGGMISEQLWNAEDLGGMRRGLPTGAAMPLCWAHAEYLSLVRSAHDGVCFDRVEPAFQRYVVHPVASRHEIWSFRHPLRRISPGKILRLIVAAEATVAWSADNWASTNRLDTTHNSALNVWSADLSTEGCPDGVVIAFTFFWKVAQRQEDRNYSVAVSGPK